MSEHIPAQATVIPFTPPALEKRDPKPVFWIKVPTPTERDTLSSALYRAGAREVTQEIVRATLIDALYDIYPEDEADEKAVMLDTFWQTNKLDEQAFARWHEQEIERQRDVENGAPDNGPEPMPSAVTSPRSKARARLLVDEVTDVSPRMQAIMERRLNFSIQQALAMVRLHVVKIEALSLPVPVAAGPDHMLSEEMASAVRNAMSDKAWAELIDKIDNLYALEVEEEKNFDSPLGKPSVPSGSPEPSDASASSDGKWTDSNIEPLHPVESAPTTA